MKEQNLARRIIKHISMCMLPIVPVLVAGGLMKIILLLLGYTPLFGAFPGTKEILTALSNAPFYFLPILVTYTASVHFKTDTVSALCVTGSLLLPEFISLMSGADPVSFVGIPVFKMSYAYTVFPIMILIWIMSFIEREAEKRLKGMASAIFSHLLVIVVTSLAGILAVGPLIGFLSRGLAAAITYFQVKSPVFAWVLFDATAPLQIMTGTHWIFVSMAITNLGESGVDSGFMVGYFTLTMSVAAVSLGVRLRTRDKEFADDALTAFITVFVTGTTEPGLFGLCLRNTRVLAAAILGGAAAGIYQGLAGIRCYVYSFPSVFSCLMFYSRDDRGNMIKALIAGAISFTVTFLIVMLRYRDSETIHASSSVPEPDRN